MNRLLGILLVILTLGSCNTFLFHRSMPEAGTILREIPGWLDGFYLVDTVGAYEFDRVSDSRCMIYMRQVFKENEIPKIVSDLKNEGKREVKFVGRNLFVVNDEGELDVTTYERRGEYYVGPALFFAEINLELNLFRQDAGLDPEDDERIMWKEFEGIHYLNVVDGNYWVVYRLRPDNGQINFAEMTVPASKLEDDLPYYSSIAPIDSVNGKWICSANDDQFFQLFSEPGLLDETLWEKVEFNEDTSSSSGNYNNYLLMAALFLIGIGLGRMIKT